MKYPIVLHRTDLDLSPSRSEVIYSDTNKAGQSFHEAIGKCLRWAVFIAFSEWHSLRVSTRMSIERKDAHLKVE